MHKPFEFEIEGNVFRMERISKSELNALTDLFNKARDRKLKYSFFEKKYDTAWTGKSNIAIVIKDQKNSIIGHLGVLPQFVQIGKNKILAGQISDAVLDPVLRGQNVFEKLISELASLSKDEGLAFLFVSPSPQAVKGFELDNWKEVNHLKIYVIPVKAIPLNKAFNKLSWFKAYHAFIQLVLPLISKKTKKFTNPNFDIEKNGLDISREYILHKNYTNNYLVKKGKFTFWFKIEDGLEIGNIEFFPESEFPEFLKTLKSFAGFLGCHQVKIVTTEGTFQDKIFSGQQLIEGNKIYFKALNDEPEFGDILINGSDLNTF